MLGAPVADFVLSPFAVAGHCDPCRCSVRSASRRNLPRGEPQGCRVYHSALRQSKLGCNAGCTSELICTFSESEECGVPAQRATLARATPRKLCSGSGGRKANHGASGHGSGILDFTSEHSLRSPGALTSTWAISKEWLTTIHTTVVGTEGH